ncbi:hypothetical protein RU95_GL004124 [Enterococcus avium]|nr:hypothetical protein RU95_GL004124 [Enterococcus avium]
MIDGLGNPLVFFLYERQTKNAISAIHLLEQIEVAERKEILMPKS